MLYTNPTQADAIIIAMATLLLSIYKGNFVVCVLTAILAYGTLSELFAIKVIEIIISWHVRKCSLVEFYRCF
jgi:hypothetical protein